MFELRNVVDELLPVCCIVDIGHFHFSAFQDLALLRNLDQQRDAIWMLMETENQTLR